MTRRRIRPALAAVACCLAAWRAWPGSTAWGSLEARLAGIVAGDRRNDLPCVTVLAARPIILLALGQSNAANHGAPSGAVHEVTLIEDGRCRSRWACGSARS